MTKDQATQASLLSRVRCTDDIAAWQEFELRYRDLLVRFCRSSGFQVADAEDVVQIVFANLARALPRFQYDRARGRFRDYLYRCARNAMAQWSQQPRPGRLALGTDTGISIDAAGSHQPELESVWHAEWVGFHYRLAMEAIRRDFDPRSVEVFEATLAGRSVSQCAQAAGLTDQAVYKIRQRIRARMEELILQQVREEDDPDS